MSSDGWTKGLLKVLDDAMDDSSFWTQTITTEPATFTVKMLTDAARQIQAGRSLHSTGSFHASNTKVKTVSRVDGFGTDYTTVDRMANPYRPGTVPHKDWMRAWVSAHYHWQTDTYKQHQAEVSDARDQMIESCAPVANWVDEVLFEVAEARAECENVPHDRLWLDEVDWLGQMPEFKLLAYGGVVPRSVGDHARLIDISMT